MDQEVQAGTGEDQGPVNRVVPYVHCTQRELPTKIGVAQQTAKAVIREGQDRVVERILALVDVEEKVPARCHGQTTH